MRSKESLFSAPSVPVGSDLCVLCVKSFSVLLVVATANGRSRKPLILQQI
jgi:hypothetical protein